MTFTPMPVFVPIRSKPRLCPDCGKSEDIREICAHCKYEYPNDSDNEPPLLLFWILFSGGVVGGVFPQLVTGPMIYTEIDPFIRVCAVLLGAVEAPLAILIVYFIGRSIYRTIKLIIK